MTENLSVSWDEYQNNICKGLSALQQRGEFVDMTIAADGHHVKVHQMVLSLVSPFIKQLIRATNCPHPVIFLNRVSFETMQAILEYAYTGEVVVKKDKMGEFLEACKDLHIKGLENMLKDAQKTVSSITNNHKNHQPFDEWNEPNESSYKKRKKNEHEIEADETDHLDDEGDCDFENDVYDEMQVKTTQSTENDNPPVTTNKHTQNATKKEAAPNIQYSVSCQGNLQIVINRYLYALRHIRKNKEMFWRCISQQKTGCPAIVTTLEDDIKQRAFPHNHPFHDEQILKRTKNGNIFTSISEGKDAAAEKKQKKADSDLTRL